MGSGSNAHPADLPLVICGPDGRPVGVLLENEKGYRKSLEQGELWALHPQTRRLLPYHAGNPVTVTLCDGWYQAVLSRAPDEAGATNPTAESTPADRPPDADLPPGGSATPGAGATPSDADSGSDIGTVLRRLAAVIADRHVRLPDGSYTTHLFTSGSEKIRKKTGEEAVELILAPDRRTIVSESADLIYHLLVLLEHEEITLDALAHELSSR